MGCCPAPPGRSSSRTEPPEHLGRYGHFAQALDRPAGPPQALDHRGHGRTRESTGVGKLGPSGAQGLLDDLGTLVGLAAERVPDKPVILLGHSMGSVLAQAFAATRTHQLAGYVLSGPLGVTDGPNELADNIQQAIDGLAEQPLDLGEFNGPFEPGRTRFDWLSRDPAEVDRYIADPLCGEGNPLTLGYIAEVLALIDAGADPSTLSSMPRIPVLLVAGEMDPAGAMTANVRVLEGRLRQGGLDVTAIYYPEARHEVLNETNRDEVTADIIAWLARFE